MVSMSNALVNVMLSVAKHLRHRSLVDSQCMVVMDSSLRFAPFRMTFLGVEIDSSYSLLISQSTICSTSALSAKSLSDFERCQTDDHQHDSDDVKARHDLRFRDSHHLEVMVNGRHAEDAPSFAVFFLRVFEIQTLNDH